MADYCVLWSILTFAMHFISADETKKGRVFEDYVANRLTKKGFHEWHRGKLKAFDGTEKEVDISLLNQNTLFLCELKCINRSFAFERGDKQAISFRNNKLSAALDECDGKATWLALRPEGRNYKLPESVAAIIPIVVSPYAEYIWSTREFYWLI